MQVPCLDGLPICGAVGDQHAALLGHACLDVGSSKNTYGTGPTDPRPGTVQVQSGYMFLVFLSISLSFESRRVQRESQDAIGRNAFLELQYTIFFKRYYFHFKFLPFEMNIVGFFGLPLPFVCFWPQGVSYFSTLAWKLCHPSMASLPPLDTNWAQRIDARKRRHTETHGDTT